MKILFIPGGGGADRLTLVRKQEALSLTQPWFIATEHPSEHLQRHIDVPLRPLMNVDPQRLIARLVPFHAKIAWQRMLGNVSQIIPLHIDVQIACDNLGGLVAIIHPRTPSAAQGPHEMASTMLHGLT